MAQALLRTQARKYRRSLPDLRPGYTVRVHQKVQEGGKERIQIFEGLVISMHRGTSPTDASFTVRRVIEGVGVEKIFPLCSPLVTKVDVVKVAPVRRAKLFFLRNRQGNAAKLSERFTTGGEFTVAVTAPAEAKTEEGIVEKKGQDPSFAQPPPRLRPASKATEGRQG